MMKRFQYTKGSFRTRSQKRSKIFTSLVLVIGLFLLLSIVWPNILTGTLHSISKPFWSVKTNITSGSSALSVSSFFKDKKSLLGENNLLKEEINDLEQKLLELGLIRAENERLQEALGMTSSAEDVIFAYILSKPNQTLYDSIILNAGIEEGVRVGDFVRSGESIILGEIVGVQRVTSQARLFSTPDIKSDVVIGGFLAAVATGAGGGNFHIALPRDIIVKEGMSVRLSSKPRTLLGFIEAIESKSSDSFQRIFVKSPVNITEIGDILIVHINE